MKKMRLGQAAAAGKINIEEVSTEINRSKSISESFGHFRYEYISKGIKTRLDKEESQRREKKKEMVE